LDARTKQCAHFNRRECSGASDTDTGAGTDVRRECSGASDTDTGAGTDVPSLETAGTQKVTVEFREAPRRVLGSEGFTPFSRI